MNFKLKITPTTKKVLKELKNNPGNIKNYISVKKVISFLGTNPRHPGLQTHIIYSFCGPPGEKVFEAYV